MATRTLYGNSYKIKVTENFHKRFTALPQNMPNGDYTFVVWLEERKSWLLTNIYWCYKFINKNNEVVHKDEMCVTNDNICRKKKAFVSELVNYAYKYDCWEDWLFCSHNQEFRLTNFEVGDTLENSSFEVEVPFDSVTFDWCLKRFKAFGIDTDKYDTYYKYEWKVSKSYAKIYYDGVCIYNHPKPSYVLAVLGWFLAPYIR